MSNAACVTAKEKPWKRCGDKHCACVTTCVAMTTTSRIRGLIKILCVSSLVQTCVYAAYELFTYLSVPVKFPNFQSSHPILILLPAFEF